MDENAIVYIKTNTSGLIYDVNSSTCLANTNDWIAIDRGSGLKYRNAQGYYFDKPFMDDNNIKRYKVAENPVDGDGHFHVFEVDGMAFGIYERTQEEMDADYAARPAPPLTDKQRISQLEVELAAAKILLGLEE